MSALTSKLLSHSTLGLALLCTSLTASADWTLDNDASSLHYLTSKAGAITELNSFTDLSGSIKGQGLAVLDISLASVDTAIPIRDERMRDILFKVTENPLASVEVDVSGLNLKDSPEGTLLQEHLVAAFTMNGVTNSVETDFAIAVLSDGDLLITNRTPLVINAGAYGLEAGVEELREVAGLPSINNNVIVSFSLVYRQD